MAVTNNQDLVGCSLKMARLITMMALLGLQIGISMESPPRISACRLVFKAKPNDNGSAWTETYTFSQGVSCVAEVTLQNTDDAMVNLTDPRNCANFYKCQGLSCFQCPCPLGETFNPHTLRCDQSEAVCECQADEPAIETTTPISTDISISQITTDKPVDRVIPSANNNQLTTNPPSTNNTNGIAIIAVIVAATVIILAALVIGFCLWQRGLLPLRKKDSMQHPSSNDGYLHTLPPQERHVYAEIDERSAAAHDAHTRQIAEDARRQLQHIYAPPVPINPPPTCVHHPHQTFVLPSDHQPRLYPQFSGHPLHQQQIQQMPQQRDLIRFHSPTGEMNRKNLNQNQNNNQNILEPSDDHSITSCSGCSHCSALSAQTQSHEPVDNRNLLRTNTPPLSQWNNNITASKQMYV